MVMTDPIAEVLAALARPGRDTSDYDLNPGSPRPASRDLRPAAVLVAIQTRPQGAFVVMTKRASHLKHHPGQIAFPGGKVEAFDRDVMAAALREAEEEIGLGPAETEVLGETEPHETVTGFRVTPVLARVSVAFCPIKQDDEVEEVFFVPLGHVTNPANFRIEGRRWRGQMRHYYVVPYGPYYIWGATARILKALADRMV
jgi:8-oxo-dGTP pyrophosphatase MutT (NUDIX family)